MEALKVDDVINESSLDLGDVLEESWLTCALVKHEVKVEELSDEQVDIPRENSIQSSRNTTSSATNETLGIKKEKLQSELKSLPIFKAEKDINVGKLNHQWSDGKPKDLYLIYKCNEQTIKEEHLVESKIIDQDERDIKYEDEETIKEEHLVEECDIKYEVEETIKEEYFIESEILVQEQLDIKDEDGQDQFPTKLAIRKVKKRHHPRSRTSRRFRLTEPSIFKCFNCTYETHRKPNLTRHVVNHLGNILKCSHCSYKHWDETAFRKHELGHAPEKLHRCPECSYTSVKKCYLTQHMVKHTKGDDAIWYQCPECSYKTKNRVDLIHKHILIHNKGISTQNHIFICKKNLLKHKCTLCCYETHGRSDLTKHIELKHGPKDVLSFHWQEEGCLYKTYHKPYLTRHIRIMHKRKMYLCSKCPYQMKHRQSFKAHELGHEDRNKWFSCPLCPHKTTSAYHLKQHMVVHKSESEIKWFHCSLCPYKTKRNRSLRYHKLIHK